MLRAALLLLAAVCAAGAAPGALGANRATFTDESGDACCTEDITQVVVSNDDAGMITFAVTAPLRPDSGSASDRFIEITTEKGLFVIGTNPDGEGYVLWRGAFKVLLGGVDESHRGDVFRFWVDRHRLADTNRFRFSVAFWSVSSLGANVDGAGTWPFLVKLDLDSIQSVLGLPQHSGGSRFAASLALRVGRSTHTLASGTILCTASVGRRRLRVLSREFVGRRAVCVWKVPRWARGKVVRGVIGVRVTDHSSSLKRRSFRRALT